VCTASWLARPDGFELFFNRDESRRRQRALPPRLLEVEGTRYLAPIDADAGGTWLGVNEHGLAVGVLNAWESEFEPRPPVVSRGALVRELLAAGTPAEVEERLGGRDLTVFRGFRLAVFAPAEPPRVLAWTGSELRGEPVRMPLASSSRGAEQAHAARRRVLERMSAGGEPDAGLLEAFHRSHEPERGVWSPCMHREEASTVSASHVRVGAAEVAFRYADGPPCRASFGAALSLRRTPDAPRA